MKQCAILITSFVRNSDDLMMLYTCIFSVAKHYDLTITDIVVLDDNHTKSDCISVPSFCKVEKTKIPQGGEVNAFFWAAQNKVAYERFIFIHDSVILISALPDMELLPIMPFWYSSRDANQNCEFEKIKDIIASFVIDGTTCVEDVIEIINGNGTIVFGGMCMFQSSFIDELLNRTNLLETLHKINNRYLRCFFERLLYITIKKIYKLGIHKFQTLCVCGDIQHHGDYYSNKDVFDLSKSNNPYLLKVWKGR